LIGSAPQISAFEYRIDATFNGTANNSDKANALAKGSDGNLYVVGYVNDTVGGQNIWVGKYDSSLNLITSARIDGSANGSDSGNGIVIDGSGNVYVIGYVDETVGGRNIWVGKFNSSLTLQSSVTVNGSGNAGDQGEGIAIDSNSNIYLIGTVFEPIGSGGNNIWIAKYNTSLAQQGSITINGPGNDGDEGYGITTDNSGNIYVTGYIRQVAGVTDVWIAKYNSSLTLQNSATINGSANIGDIGYGITTDGSQNVYITGTVQQTGGGVGDIIIARYNSSIVFQQQQIINGSDNGFDFGRGITRDVAGNLLLTGYITEGTKGKLWIAKYSSALVLQSSATVIDAGGVGANGSAILTSGSSIFVAGQISNPPNASDGLLSRYSTPTAPTGFSGTVLGVSSITWSWTDSDGESSYQVFSSTGGALSQALPVNSTTWTEIGLEASTSYSRFVRAVNSLGVSSSSINSATTSDNTTSSTNTIPSTGGTITFNSVFGDIVLGVPSGSFPQSVFVSFLVPGSFASDQTSPTHLTGTGVGVQITLSPSLQPTDNLTLTVNYRDADVVGFNENKLVLARYNETDGLWVPMPSTPDAPNNRVTSQVNHLSIFQIMESEPSSGVSDAKAFPNPFRPSQGHTILTFSNIPSDSLLRIYDFSGEEITTLRANASGMAPWDAKNDSGQLVASGVYFVVIEGNGDKKTIKVAIQR